MTSNGQEIALCVTALYFPQWTVVRKALQTFSLPKGYSWQLCDGAEPELIKNSTSGPGSWHHTENDNL